MGYRLNRAVGDFGAKLVRWAQRDSNMVRHARSEWKIVFPEPDDMQDAILENILDVVAVFGLAGHSVFSAGYSIGFVEKALRFEPFGPLKGTDDEWVHVGDYGGDAVFQNKRLSSVFKGADGRAYDINGKIYREPDGNCFTRGGERNYIEFPYVAPPVQYIDVDEEGKEIEQPKARVFSLDAGNFVNEAKRFTINPGWVETVVQRLTGRIEFLRHRGQVKDPELMEEAVQAIKGLQQENKS